MSTDNRVYVETNGVRLAMCGLCGNLDLYCVCQMFEDDFRARLLKVVRERGLTATAEMEPKNVVDGGEGVK